MSDVLNSLKEPGSKKWVIVSGGAVAAYLAYKYYKNKSAAATSSAGTPATGVTADTASEASLIDPNTGIPYSEEEDYGAIPSGLTFDAQTGQFVPAASTIVGQPYSANSNGQGTPVGDPNAIASNLLSAYAYNAGKPGGGYYAVTSNGTTVHLTPAEQIALAQQNYQFGSISGAPNSSPIPAATTTS